MSTFLRSHFSANKCQSETRTMSRHRLIRNSRFDDDLDEEDDYNYDDYGSSPISPSASQYMFKRDASSGGKNALLSAFLDRQKDASLSPKAAAAAPAAAAAAAAANNNNNKRTNDAALDRAMAQLLDILGDNLGGHAEDHVHAVASLLCCYMCIK